MQSPQKVKVKKPNVRRPVTLERCKQYHGVRVGRILDSGPRSFLIERKTTYPGHAFRLNRHCEESETGMESLEGNGFGRDVRLGVLVHLPQALAVR